MKFIPHNYQKYSCEFIKEHEAAAIFLDCGLGKTVITLTALYDLLFDSFTIHKVLVIAPLRVCIQWKYEADKWDHLHNLICSVALGTADERRAALTRKADIYIVNRENVQWLVENTQFDYDTVVIDELSSFKNHQAKRFRAIMKVRPKVKRIVGLTGTPTANGLMDQRPPASAARSVFEAGYRGQHPQMEQRRTARRADPPGVSGTRLEPAKRRFDPRVVRSDMVAGTVSTNSGAAVAAGSAKRNRSE